MNRQEELERLLREFTEDEGFCDKYGYIVHQIKETSDAQDNVMVKPDALGEATLYTAIAAIAISTGNYIQDEWDKNYANAKLQELLTVLLKEGWGNKDNLERKHPIRHPEDIDYYRNGDDIKQRMSPLSKDSFGAIVAASYYCYSCPNSSQEVRQLARDLITKWTDYLILFQWRTHSIYIEGEFERSEQDDDYYKNIYSDDNLTNRKMYKGLESFMLWPHEMYALQNAAAHLGVPTSHWKVWEKIPVELNQTIVDFAAPYLAQYAGENLDIFLKNFHFVIPYSIQIVPNWPSGKVEGLFVVEIPSHTREQIVNTFKETLKDLIREIVRTGNYTNYQSDELLGILINRILNLFPDTLGPDSWRSILNKSIQQILPWITGEGWIEALTFLGFLQLLKLTNTSTISYTLWTYAIECETRPEIKDILKAALQDFYSYLRGNDNPNSLWGWIAEDSEIVNKHIHLFEANEWNYWWKFAYQENKFNDWLKEAENPSNNEGNKRKSPRLDYLVLSGVAEKGPPAGTNSNLSSLLEVLRDLVKDAASHFINNLTAEIQRQFNQAGYYIRETLTAAGILIKETWSNTLESTRESLLQGELIGKSTWDQTGTLIQNMSKIDDKIVEEYWNRSTEKYWKGVWSTVEGRAADMIERAINTL
ncbi:hypothetical protein CN331_17940, partial [Bacillus cereus]|uniref:hypothetical protein n=1 Tax=Bacillus cereus TaxID=1396 RepID=UPI000BFAFE62